MTRNPGEFELFVMLAIAQSGGESYGAEVRREIEARAGRSVAVGAVYETLARLSDKGFVSSRVTDPLPVQGGRARKCFRLTANGKRALRRSLTMLGRMAEGLELG